MSICTKAEVYTFMQTGDAQRIAANDTMIEALILSVEFMIERFIGRKISATAFDLQLHDGRYCSINGRYIFMNGFYYDILEIGTLEENGVALTEGTDFVIQSPNVIERINTQWNASNQLGIAITGLVGLVYDNSETDEANYVANPDVKQIAIEAVAMKSGLWTKNLTDGDGNEFEVVKQNLPKISMEHLKRYIVPVL
ncbi:hypothetical protein [Polynucleobacter sp.]|uniref:hypothetical protein n=1 Tax=Polynucleobacter sp. TaxID=2029855 RepID=UPI003F6A1253